MSAKGFERSHHLLQKVEDEKRVVDVVPLQWFEMFWDDEMIFINTGIKVHKQLISNQDVLLPSIGRGYLLGTCMKYEIVKMGLFSGFCSSSWKCCMPNMLDAMSLQQTTWTLVPTTNSTSVFLGSIILNDSVSNVILHVFLGSLWDHFASFG